MSRRRRFRPQRIVHNIKFWTIEIIALIVFLNWAGKAMLHELGFSHPPGQKAQTCVAERERK